MAVDSGRLQRKRETDKQVDKQVAGHWVETGRQTDDSWKAYR